MGGNRRHVGRSRIAALAAGAAVLALALPLSACGGGDSSSAADEPAGAYEVELLAAELPPKQRLGETTLLRLGVRNSGDEAVPGLAVSFTIGGEQGVNSGLPFGYRSPEPALAQPDRPIWVLADDYPKANGSSRRAGAETSSPKTFEFGRLEPGEATEAVWKLIAVRTGDHVIRYRVSAGLGGEATAETAAGEPVAGRLPAQIVAAPPDTVVTDNGQVVPAPKDPTAANR